jgi:O-antigen/teichoic acid export membrane protein
LAWWINPEFAEQSYRVAELIAVGVFINSFGHLSQSLVQAFGRPDLTAKLHVVEFALYVPYLVWLIDRAGLEGAAIAWVVRVSLSTVALWALAARCLAGQFKSRY